MFNISKYKVCCRAISIGLVVLVEPALANGWSFEASTYIDRSAGSSDEEYGQRLDLHDRYGFRFSGSNLLRMDDGYSRNFGFMLSTEQYPGHQDLDRFRLSLSYQYMIPLTTGPLRQLRFAGEVSHARNRDDWVFNRIRLSTAVRINPLKRHTVQLRARIGFRDQNEDVLANFDQTELLLDALHLWVSEDRRTRTATTKYFERRNADYDRFSYTEVGARFTGRRMLSEDLNLIGQVVTYIRDYDEGGRHDTHVRASLGLEWQLNSDTTVDAYAGLQKNASTIESKEYQGPIFGIQLTRRF